MDFKIVNFDPSSGVASLGIPDVTKKISGFDKLVQIVVLELLRNPGRNVLNPMEGSGLRDSIGKFGFIDQSEVRTFVIQRIDQVKTNIISIQTEENVPDMSERLRNIEIVSFSFDQTESFAYVNIRIYNELGQSRSVIV